MKITLADIFRAEAIWVEDGQAYIKLEGQTYKFI
jgi:hypothetical protein